jgi:hypothetical protein
MKKTTKILSLAAASLLAACSNQAAPAKETTTAAPGTTVQQTTQAPATTVTATTSTATTSSATTNSSQSMGSQNAMQKELIDTFKKAFPDLDITTIEFVNGMYYEIEAINDTKEYTYRYDKATKSFSKYAEVPAEPGERNEEKIDTASLKQVDDMAAVAQKEYPNGSIREWSVDRDDGEVIWEFDIYLGANDDVTVKVSNATGKVTEIDR